MAKASLRKRSKKRKSRKSVPKKKISKSRYLLLGYYIGSAILAISFYYFVFYAYQPPASSVHTYELTLASPNAGPLFSCLGVSPANCTIPEFFQIPITLTYHNTSITQYQEVVITSSGGAISSSLAKGLTFIEVNFQKDVGYAPAGVSIPHLIDVILLPVNQTDSGIPKVEALVQIGNGTHVEWQGIGTDFPTVTFLYENNTNPSIQFPDKAIDVQSLDTANEIVISDIHWHQEYGLLFLGIIVPIDGAIEAAYRHVNPKDRT